MTDAANTGIYILSPSVLSHIPDNTAFDLQRICFRSFEEGIPLFAYEATGYWCDIGNLEHISFLSAIFSRAGCALPPPEGGVLCRSERPQGGYTITPPVYIGRDVSIGTGAQIGPFAVLEDGQGSNGAKIRGSVLLGPYAGDDIFDRYAAVPRGLVRRGASPFEGRQ